MAKKSAVGLDIGTKTVQVVQLAHVKGQPTITNFGGIELPESSVREGEILDPDAVSGAIRELMASTGIKQKDVWLGIANQRVVVRQIDVPWMEEAELRSSLRFQVQEYIPIPVEETELDFFVLDQIDGDGDTRMLRLLLVAAHKDMVAAHVQAVTQAGLRPVGVDLNPFAMLRALTADSIGSTAGEVLVDVGAGVTNILVHESGIPRFVRILVMGGGDITEGLVSGMGISSDDAERLKREIGLSATTNGEPGPQIVERHASEFIDEVRNSLDYYQAQAGSARVGRVLLVGGGAMLNGLADRLGHALRLPVEIANPFDRHPTKDTVYGPEQLAQVGPVLTTSVGLALGGVA